MQMEVFVVVFTPCHKTTNTVAGVVQALMSYSLQSAYKSILSYIRVDTACATLPPSSLPSTLLPPQSSPLFLTVSHAVDKRHHVHPFKIPYTYIIIQYGIRP